VSSPLSRRKYKFAMEQFITWYCSNAVTSAPSQRSFSARYSPDAFCRSLQHHRMQRRSDWRQARSTSGLRQSGSWPARLQFPVCSAAADIRRVKGSPICEFFIFTGADLRCCDRSCAEPVHGDIEVDDILLTAKRHPTIAPSLR
jgi:hypothetical protein